MKKLILMLMLMPLGGLMMQAQEPERNVINSYELQPTQSPIEITFQELPEAVKERLGDEPFANYAIDRIYMEKQSSNTALYSIDFIVEEETRVVNFDASGNVIN